MKRTLPLLALCIAVALPASAQPNRQPDRFGALVFTRTAGYRHASIPDGIAAVVRLGDRNGFSVDATEDPAIFTPDMLQRYRVIIFLSTTGDVLDSEQESALQRWVESGGGLVGVHAAADTEYEWGWYGDAMGGYFKSHPRNQTATIRVEDASHPSTEHLPSEWVRLDEWYNYRSNPREKAHVLLTLDESTYEGGEMGDDHPISWAHSVGEGRVWYTGLGHTEESFVEEAFVQHLLGGILWASGEVGEDLGAAGTVPEGTFEKVILNDDTLDPFEIDVANDGRVFFIERAGALRIWHPDTERTSTAGYVPVRTTGENGMLGLALDPDFDQNHWLYMLYTVPDGEPRQHLSRFFLDGDQLDPASKKVLLEIPLTLGECCHSGGSLAFGPDGNLFVSVGDETNPFASDGFNPIDERKGRDVWDAQRSAANTQDLRGKILRITPLDDGTYAIPEGNLFPPDGSVGRPEIYVMGNRNPFRITIDQERGWLLWGEVGPDAGAPNETRGPAGHDEINLARGPGNYGWPYFTGDNKAYHDFDYTTLTPGAAFDPARPVNDSPNNTGSRVLPPAQPALIWYTYGPSEEFPQLEAGGRTAIAGPVFHYDAEDASIAGALPASYDGTFFFGEWQRNQLFTARLDADGNLVSFERFMPDMEFLRPMDMDIGPDGRFYLIEWGTSYGGNNPDARIVRLDFTPGRTAGAASPSPEEGRPDLGFVAPISGTVAWPGAALAYEVSVPDGVDPATVRVSAVLESDGNDLARVDAAGAAGSLELPEGMSRWPELVSRRWRIEATHAASGGERTAVTFVYPPSIEAEHTARLSQVSKSVSFDAEQGSTDAGLMLLGDSWAAYGPLLFSGATAVSIDLAPFSAGTLAFHQGAPDGPVIASANVTGEGARELLADTATVAARFSTLYDDENLYLLVEVEDDDVQTRSETEAGNDRIELYFDAGHEQGISYDDNDLRIDVPIGRGPDGAVSKTGPPEMTYAMHQTDGGYVLEATIPWSTIGKMPVEGDQIGFEIHINDLDAGRSDRTLAWSALRDVAFSEPRVFGTLQIGGEAPSRRRRGALVTAERTNVAVEADGIVDSAWSLTDPIRMQRQMGPGGAPANLMQLRETVTARIEAPDEPVDVYVRFVPDAERGRVFVDRISFEK